jgi:hypothetical protein
LTGTTMSGRPGRALPVDPQQASSIAVDMVDNARALPTCPQRQQQQQTADRNRLKSPTRSRDEAKKKIAEIAADKRLSKRGKRELLNEYEKRLKAAQPIQYPGNIELVRKYYDKIRTIRQDTRG